MLRVLGSWFRSLDDQTLAALGLVSVWAATLLPFLSVAARNTRLVEVFNADEAMQANLIVHALHTHSWKLLFGAYGHLYLNLILVPLTALAPVSDTLVVETGRAISLASAVALLLFSAWWARRAYGSAAAWLTLLLIALNPTVYTWAVMLHPDMLQALLLMAALYCTACALERPTTACLLWASAAAGLAFAAKYSGMFVLPLIAVAAVGRRTVGGGSAASRRLMVARTVLALMALTLLAAFAIDANWIVRHVTADGHVDVPLVMSLDTLVVVIRAAGVALTAAVATPWLWRGLHRRQALATTLWGFGVVLAIFVAAFAVASPYSLWKLAFLKGLYFEAVETGARMNVQWVEGWITGAIGAIGWSIVVPAACATMWLLARRNRDRLLSIDIVLIGWMAIYSLVLLAPCHELFFHYTLPMIAPAALLASRGIIAAWGALAEALSRQRRAIALAGVCATMVLCEAPGVVTLATTRAASLRREETLPVVVGEWLERRMPASSTVVYDYMSYVPPKFARAEGTWGGSREWLASVDPDLVVVNRGALTASSGHPDQETYYRCLEDGSCGYRRVFAVEYMSVYERVAGGRVVRASF